MLAHLKIENVAVIEKAEVDFSSGFNVLTGETGAGKSILIDSIHAILGDRTSRELVRTGAEKARIWATFCHLPTGVQARLEQSGYEAAEELLLYREITPEGKSSCRVNGLPATAAVVRQICDGLISIYGQHDSQSLTNPARHLGLLDAYAQNRSAHEAYYKVYRELVSVKRQADALRTDETEKQRRTELLRYQIEELEAVDLTPGEDEQLEQRRQVMLHAQNILESLQAAHAALDGTEEGGGAADLLGSAAGALGQAAQLDAALTPLTEQLNDAYYAARDIAVELADRLEGYGFNPVEQEQLEQRLDTLFRIKQKYGGSIEQALDSLQKAQEELDGMEHAQERLQELESQKRALYTQAKQLAEELTETRLDAFKRLNEQLTEALTFLNMPGVRFSLQHSRGPLASAGQDTVEFYISANPGEAPKPLAKIASGGELSRVMLAIKSALADKDDIPTVIYDEIDTGVSGLAASRIGQKLRQTAQGRQVLCITHTAQIAALADSHLLIQKNVENDRTYTEINPLDDEGRVQALARIIAGEGVTELSLASAREMLQSRVDENFAEKTLR